VRPEVARPAPPRLRRHPRVRGPLEARADQGAARHRVARGLDRSRRTPAGARRATGGGARRNGPHLRRGYRPPRPGVPEPHREQLDACTDPIELRIAYSDAWLEEGPAVRMAVRDNGPGAAPTPK